MSSTRNKILLAVLFIVVMVGWQWLIHQIWPVKTIPPKPTQESVTLVMGGMASGVHEVADLHRAGKIEQNEEAKKEP